MAQGNSGVIFPAGQKHGKGLSHDIGASHNDGVLAGSGNAHSLQQHQYSMGCAGQIGFASNHHVAHVHGMKAVHILFRPDGHNHLVLVNMTGQGQLHQNAMHAVVLVQLLNQPQQVKFSRVPGEANVLAQHSSLLQGPFLGGNVRHAGRILTHQYHCQTGSDSLKPQLRCLFRCLVANLLGDGKTVDNLCTHDESSFGKTVTEGLFPLFSTYGADAHSVISTLKMKVF